MSDNRDDLTELQKRVIYEDDTEQPFNNAFWNHKQEGIYVDITNGDPLFSSRDKFDSGTGWPSFTKPITKNTLVERTDTSGGKVRIEVRTKNSNIHLGHVFKDGPKDKGGLRYCINSAALRFIPKEKLTSENSCKS